MLGRRDYTKDELGAARTHITRAVTAYKKLAKAIAATGDPRARAALEAFEPEFCNNMTLVLDRYFVHRLRQLTGKDGNPLNEVELLSDSLMANDAILRVNNIVKYVPTESVLNLGIGDHIQMNLAAYEQLADDFLADIERKFM